MTIDKMDYEWAETGTRTPAPSDEKIQEGWVAGDKAPIEYFNWLAYRQDDKINRLIRERLDSFYTDATDPQGMLTTGVWSEDWGCTVGTENYLDASDATKEFVDIKVYFDSSNNPRLMALDMAANKIQIFDPRTMASIVVSDDLTSDMAGGDTYYAQAMCTDGTSVYVVFFNDTDNTLEVNCWTIDESSSNWTCEWAAHSDEITLTGNRAWSGAPTSRFADICIANDTKIAVVTGHLSISASNIATISILLKTTGAIQTSGSGDCTTGASYYGVTNSLCSDGTNIYFGAIDSTPNILFCSATITDATAGCGGTGYPVARATRNDVVLACNGNSVVSAYSKASSWAQDDEVIKSHNSAEGSLDRIRICNDTQGAPVTSDLYGVANAGHICFDGLNFWIVSKFDTQPTDGGYKITKMDSAKFGLDVPNTYRTVDAMQFPTFIIAQNIGLATASDAFIRIAFDGRDIWVNVECRASQTASGRIYRLPLALIRS